MADFEERWPVEEMPTVEAPPRPTSQQPQQFPTDSGPGDVRRAWEPIVTKAQRRAGLTTKEVTPPLVKDDASYDTVAPGTDFVTVDETGKRTIRTKPYEVQFDSDFDLVPEGADFIDPFGTLRTKPKYEPISNTAQILYNLARNDKTRMNVLEKFYPGKVKRNDAGETYIDDDGVQRKPKGFRDAPWSAIGGGAAPFVGSVGGEIAGGILGSGIPVAGSFAGGTAGAAAGGAAGEAFNTLILQLAGVRDTSLGEEVGAMATTGGLSALGAGVGRGMAAAGKGSTMVNPAWVLGKATGAHKEGLEMGLDILGKSENIPKRVLPVEPMLREAPHLQNIVQFYDPTHRKWNPLKTFQENYYEQQTAKILSDLGVQDAGSMLKPTAAVPTEAAGQAVIKRAADEAAKADAAVAQRILDAQNSLAAGKQSAAQAHEQVLAAADRSRAAADTLIKLGFDEIESTVGEAMKKARAGSDPSKVWVKVGQRFGAKKEAINEKANQQYGISYKLAGNHVPNSEGLQEAASRFLQELPIEFENQYPTVIDQIRKLSGVQTMARDEAGEALLAPGAMVKPPVSATFEQLHNLRTVLRDKADWYRLDKGIRNGSYKFFANKVDDILHDANAVPELRAAAKQLDKTDKWYKKNIGVFNSRELNSVMEALRTGQPPDPEALYRTMFRAGNTSLNKKLMQMVGPTLSGAIKAADVKAIMDASKGLTPGTVDVKRFVNEVAERHRNGMLHSIHGDEMGNRLLTQAQYIEALQGKMEIPVRPGDTGWDIISRARTLADAAKKKGQSDPLQMLKNDVHDALKAQSAQQRARKQGPLGFLYEPSIGGTQAVKRILASEDLTRAVAMEWGEQSPEFTALRQIQAQNLFRNGTNLAGSLENVSENIQNMLFPGVSVRDAQTLAREMSFLNASQHSTATSMSAQSTVNTPGGNQMPLPNLLKTKLAIIKTPIVGRYILGNYFKLIASLTGKPAALKWLLDGLKGDPAARAQSLAYMQKMMQVGGAAGAGAASTLSQGPSLNNEIDPSTPLPGEQ